ncbi:MAG: DUF86 domain-containing protein, partial [Thermoleophilia bacterium]|nr:DUF86 domain-containing protein [Thermoleophilia bacterium]
MRRSPAAYLSDIVEACDAVEAVLRGVSLVDYLRARAVRSAVEREFITIGEAVNMLGRVAPQVYAQITEARLIVGFRNVLTHDYAAIDDETVFGAA